MTSFSYTTGNPSNLTAGSTASMNDIQGPFTDLRTFLNGANLDDTNTATANKRVTLLAPYRTVHELAAWSGAGNIAGTYFARSDLGGAVALVGSGGISANIRTVYLDPADLTASGSTAKMRVRLGLQTNGTAPASTYSAALFPVTGFNGGAGVLQVTSVGAALGTTSTIVAPAINSGFTAVGSDFDTPAAGTYLLGLIIATATQAANSAVNVGITLQAHHI